MSNYTHKNFRSNRVLKQCQLQLGMLPPAVGSVYSFSPINLQRMYIVQTAMNNELSTYSTIAHISIILYNG